MAACLRRRLTQRRRIVPRLVRRLALDGSGCAAAGEAGSGTDRRRRGDG